MGERTFRRWRRRYEEAGEPGLPDRRIGKASGRRVPVDRCEEVEHLYRRLSELRGIPGLDPGTPRGTAGRTEKGSSRPHGTSGWSS